MRSTSFGFGRRFIQQQLKRESPSPDSYDIRSTFEISTSHQSKRKANNKSFCFGTGREAFSKVVIPGKLNQPDPCVPGPGSYENVKVISKDAQKFSIYPKLVFNDIELIEKKKGVPGPGQYQDKLQIDKLGRYIISNYLNSKAPAFGLSSRFKHAVLVSNVPGPGQYEISGQIQKPDQCLSNFKSVAVRRFGTAQRPDASNRNSNTPGPGTYRAPSDFGYIDYKSKYNSSFKQYKAKMRSIQLQNNEQQESLGGNSQEVLANSREFDSQKKILVKRKSIDTI